MLRTPGRAVGLVLIAGLAAAVGCAKDSGTGPAADYSLTLAPAARTILQGANGATTVTITRTNFTGAVTLTVGNAPGGVTATFDPTAPTGTASTLTINVGPAVAAGVYNLTVAGNGTAGGRSTPFTLTVSSLSPSAPSNLIAAAASATQIVLTWQDNSTNEDGFRIERAPGGMTGFAEIGTVGADVTSYQNTGLVGGTSYTYRLRSYNAHGASNYSNTVTAASCSIGEPTPAYQTYRVLMAQSSASGPVYVTGGSAVPICALQEAGFMLAQMLRNRADVGTALRTAGALTGVFARTETVCDLLYFSDFVGTSTCTSAPGGLGGVPGRPATACSERNVLKQPDDPYGRGTRNTGENVCVHELAHTVMNVGLSDQDRLQIRQRFDAARAEGLWTGDYSMENADEFFAEMSQSYFCANPEVPAYLHTHGINCSTELKDYDPATFLLIDGIYRGAIDLR